MKISQERNCRMNKLHTIPAADGFRMPGEFEPHRGCIMIWPKRPGSWNYGAKKAREAFKRVAWAIAESEEVFMLAGPDVEENAREMLAGNPGHEIHVIRMESDDAWARDVAPTFVVNGEGAVRGIDWEFNAWGGTVDGLYAHWEKDDLVAEKVCGELGYGCYEAHPFVLEGGSIHSDGEGTVLVTAACLLSGGRNPKLTKDEIGKKLCAYLGAKKVIWLERGIYNDETNEHVDNICAFVRPGEVVLGWTDDEKDPQYAMSKSCLDILENETDAMGRKIKVHKLPIPKTLICVTEEELGGYEFEDGEDTREVGERLAASYVNFYISNGGVVVPQFGDEHDKTAVEILGKVFPERKICPIPARDILLGGGNIHCITQQIPQGR
ncbi:agmatine deiminase [Clostridiales bacterium AF36-10]|jgi:agmatine deiminase|nr:agmatine deiminase [Clostridiales bacterium AF36-10]